jgi:DNA-binding NarL/FixJ family response regulator
MAEGRSNQGIFDRLFLSLKTVEAHVSNTSSRSSAFEESPDDHRRVLAVLTYLRPSTG